MAVIPKTNPILAILEPMTLFNAIAGDPVNAAFKLTNNSGAEVAKLTTVIPITILEIFNLKDKATDDRTKNSPPTTNNNNPKMIQTILMYTTLYALPRKLNYFNLAKVI
jgi:hypothetical protein